MNLNTQQNYASSLLRATMYSAGISCGPYVWTQGRAGTLLATARFLWATASASNLCPSSLSMGSYRASRWSKHLTDPQRKWCKSLSREARSFKHYKHTFVGIKDLQGLRYWCERCEWFFISSSDVKTSPHSHVNTSLQSCVSGVRECKCSIVGEAYVPFLTLLAIAV